jgi:hypothetical protein
MMWRSIMQKWALFFTFVFATILSFTACQPTASPVPELETEEARQSQGASLPNLLVEVQGDVWLRRAGWGEFVPAGFGIAVFPGDLLRVDVGSVASLFCGDEASWEGGPETLSDDGMEHGIPCQAGRPPRPWKDVAALRAEGDSSYPYILQPRNSALLSDRPQIRWHEPDPGSSYSITVIAEDGKERPGFETIGGASYWPSDWAPLEVDATYLLRVSPKGKPSQDESTSAGQGFWLLDTDETEEVQEQEERLRTQSLPSTAIDLVVAELYLNHGMRSEAIGLLERVAQRDGTPAVYLSLGRVYLEVGVAWEAKAAFDQALIAAQASGELEAEAEALVGLGLSISLLGDESDALQHFESARELYEKIGAKESVEEINQLVAGN